MGHGATTETGNLGFGFLHAGFINTLKPERVLCVGSRQGYIPAVCALACKYNHYGHVDFVDAGYDAGEPDNWGGTGFWKKRSARAFFSARNRRLSHDARHDVGRICEEVSES